MSIFNSLFKPKKIKPKIRKVSFIMSSNANQERFAKLLIDADNIEGVSIISHKFRVACDLPDRSVIKLTTTTDDKFKQFLTTLIHTGGRDIWGLQWK